MAHSYSRTSLTGVFGTRTARGFRGAFLFDNSCGASDSLLTPSASIGSHKREIFLFSDALKRFISYLKYRPYFSDVTEYYLVPAQVWPGGGRRVIFR